MLCCSGPCNHTRERIMGERSRNNKGCGCCGGGIVGSIGAVLAALLSWSVNHSVLWALVHAFFSWFYVIYHWLKYGTIIP
jgi:hypothetical protein